MATISLSLSAKADKVSGKSEILIRFVVGSRINLRGKSNIFINPKHWNAKEQRIVIPQMRMMNAEQEQLIKELQGADTKLANLKEHIYEKFKEAGSGKEPLPEKWLKNTIHDYYFPKQEQTNDRWENKSFIQIFEEYMSSEEKSISRGNRAHYLVLSRLLRRYEIVREKTLDFDTITVDTIKDIKKYIQDEYDLYEKKDKALLAALNKIPECRPPKKRGENTIISFMKKLNCFIRWANGCDKKYPLKNPLTHNNPFSSFQIGTEKYGTPYFLTIEERNKLYETELPERLARQRDIFIFQCLIGCRVSDLWAMTKDNVINGAIEYIPHKTKDEKPETIRVPLNNKAKEILAKYPSGKKLLPFVAQQQYNKDIKEMLKLAGIDRMVTTLNSKTGKEEKKLIYDVASSHMARRTFIGNLYCKVQDPNLIGKLSGHAENSRAFARYRDIDEEMKRDLVSMLD